MFIPCPGRAQLFGKEKLEIVIVFNFCFILLTLLALIPYACAIRDITPFNIHSLSTSITAMKADAEPDGICILSGNLFSCVHQFASDSSSLVFFQYTKVNDLGPALSLKRTTQAC